MIRGALVFFLGLVVGVYIGMYSALLWVGGMNVVGDDL